MPKVLLIEDDAFLAEDLEFFIKEAGHGFQWYRSADEVMENMASIGTFDVIVLDLMMQKGNRLRDEDFGTPTTETGEVLFAKIVHQFPRSQLIILSAKDEAFLQRQFGTHVNVRGVIPKPVDDDRLKRLLSLLEVER